LPFNERKLFFNNFDTSGLQKLKVQFLNYLVYQDSIQFLLKQRDFRIQCRYINGRYYLTNSFITRNEIFRKGWEIIKFNEISLPDSLSAILGKGSSMPKWDYRNKRFYTNKYILGQLRINKPCKIVFADQQGTNHALVVYSDQKSKLKNIKYLSLYDQSTVKYFKKFKMLYIRLTEMSLEDGFVDKIIEVSKKNEITSTVINISGNNGGDDSAWKMLLSILLKDTLYFNYTLGFKENAAIKKYL